ncbi:hypothetical protein LVD15_20335 [Fulvivirga maritima]|uniref:hypothetical protein n=1 Tax=Fulvivirga maritima TaxID=2904247 RepID=UPI001F41ADF7|nr:hypothetical protein [Fulvivirga maritima]UII25631.1 hypothetical protein LVD15_20335 [Fulvivirga maritima]
MKSIKTLVYGVIYGLVTRLIFSLEFELNVIHTEGLMSLSFLFIMPFVLGLVLAYRHEEIIRPTKILSLAMPLFAVIGVVLICVVLRWEGTICALMAIPVFAVMALLGGYLGIELFHRKPNKMSISFLLLLPFIVAPFESYFGVSEKVFNEDTFIEVNAPKSLVWKHVTRVKPISNEENKMSLFQFLGFPKPIEAVLDTVAVGGVRIARFDRGLFFTETVTEMIPEETLSFTIKADPKAIPPAALDEHVLVGGSYFDVLHGTYHIEPLGKGKCLIKLSSKFRLSTNFNFYSGFWSKLIMRDIQTNILLILKERVERENETSTDQNINAAVF